MKAKLPSPTVLVLLGTILTVFATTLCVRSPLESAAGQNPVQPGPSQVQTCPPEQLGELIQRAILAFEGYHSVSAKVRQSVDLFGKQPLGSGVYLERRLERGVMYRFEMRMLLHDQVNSLLDIADGQYLWRYRKLRDSQTLSRVDIARVERALEEAGRMPQMEEMGQWPGMGGLVKILAGIHSKFDFVTFEETRLWGQLPAWRLQGRWKTAEIIKLLPDQEKAIREGKPVDLARLPNHLPHNIVVFLGAEDLFPYRIEYRRWMKKSDDETSGEDRLLAGIDFFEVSLNVPVDPARFMYNPGGLGFTDETDKVLADLGLHK